MAKVFHVPLLLLGPQGHKLLAVFSVRFPFGLGSCALLQKDKVMDQLIDAYIV